MPELQSVWSWMITGYLFLGGLAAGVFFLTAILRLATKDKCKKTCTFGAWFATAALALGLILLVADVEKPLQAIILFISFVNFSSWMTIGAWLLLASFIVFVLAAIFSTDALTQKLGKLWKPLESGKQTILKVLSIIGIPMSLGVAIYTGVLLGAAPSIPFWGTWLLPALFTVSALDTGIAAVLIYMLVRETDRLGEKYRAWLGRIVILLVILELIILAVYLNLMVGGTITEQISAELLLSGALSVPFWMLIIVIGLAIPLVGGIVQQFIGKKGKGSRAYLILPIGCSVCALIGGLALRYVVLSAGLHGVMISPEVVQAIHGVYFFVS